METEEKNIASTIIKGYHISTMYRKSSIQFGGMYYETMVFEYKDRKNGHVLEQEARHDEELAMQLHIDLVLKYLK